MSVISVPLELDASLVEALDRHLSAAEYSQAQSAITDNKYIAPLQNNCADTVATILKYLTDDNFTDKPDAFDAAENLLKSLANIVKPEDALFEFLEIIETTKSDNVFTSTLKALQICLLRQSDNKSRSLEWCLNSIHSYVQQLPFAEATRNNVDDKIAKLIEENDEVRRILTNYLTLFLFCEPILKDIVDKQLLVATTDGLELFRDVRITRKSVLGCFLLQLFGAPLCYLDLSAAADLSNTNTYSRQCARTLVQNFATLYPDPMFVLGYVERRLRFPPIRFRCVDDTDDDDGGAVFENAPLDVFAMQDKLPLDALLVFYYVIFAEDLMPKSCPRIYHNAYLFEACLYLIANAFNEAKDAVLHRKAIKLGTALLRRLASERIPFDSLELDVHERFCTGIVRVIVDSPVKENSQSAAVLLRQYVFQFETSARIFLVQKLFAATMTRHSGLTGYLVSMYKDMIADALNLDGTDLRAFSGIELQTMLTKYVFVLVNGSETDLIQNADHIISALNVIRYLAVRDQTNRTGFWDHVEWIRCQYLEVLRTDIDMSHAHYKLEQQQQMESGADDFNAQILANALRTFDLMDSLVSRVHECLRIGSEKI